MQGLQEIRNPRRGRASIATRSSSHSAVNAAAWIAEILLHRAAQTGAIRPSAFANWTRCSDIVRPQHGHERVGRARPLESFERSIFVVPAATELGQTASKVSLYASTILDLA